MFRLKTLTKMKLAVLSP